ncbi:MAG TPA: D-alanyl-D-alanine carboxypeptidase family protein [Candidatus Paceibacterota bacterium]
MQNPNNSAPPRKKFPSATILAILGVLVVAGLFGYGFIRINQLTDQIQELTAQLNSTHTQLSKKTNELAGDIAKTDEFTTEIARALSNSNQTVQALQFALGETSNTVEVLDKLSKTDPELLQKYSKIYFLNEHYTPIRLAQIESQYVYIEQEPEQIHAAVWPYLQNLLNAVKSNGIELFVRSAYRSFDEQEFLKASFRVTYGTGANQFSADQGYSEHQLGTTVDFISTGQNGQLDGFEKTNAYRWMRNNAHKYGFTLSYPENNAFYIFEPWHWRYVGVKLATYLHDFNKNFYDLDQREIDEYLIDLFE